MNLNKPINKLLELTKEVFSEYLVYTGDISYIYIRSDRFIKLEIKQLDYDLFTIRIVEPESKEFAIPTKNTKEFLYLFKDKYEIYQLHKDNLKLSKADFKNLTDDDVIRNMRDKKLNEIL